MTTKIADTSKSLLTHLMVAGTAALAGSAANAQIVVTNVNENIGFAPGDVSSFVSSLPGPLQFNIYRSVFDHALVHSIKLDTTRVGPIPSSVSAYLDVMASRAFGGKGYGGHGHVEPGSIWAVSSGKKWGSIHGVPTSGPDRIVSVAHRATSATITTVGGHTTTTIIALPTTTASLDRFSDRYFAFEFTDAHRGYQLDYGWIKASLTDNTYDGLNLHIDSYAYDASGAQIAMGETVAPVPEPNTALALAALSALTLGAAGVKRFKALQHPRKANP
jgi:hypothetical protein